MIVMDFPKGHSAKKHKVSQAFLKDIKEREQKILLIAVIQKLDKRKASAVLRGEKRKSVS